MIRNTVINTTNFFYPLGNTPAVCLTQDLPPGKDADILLLGCGDARNILFTCFADPERRLDVTCCDIEPAVLARNILLFSLIIDHSEDAKLRQIWNIYYHWKLDEESLNLLESQAAKLLSLSETVATWRASTYGHDIRFCDARSLTKIRDFWSGCSPCESPAARQSRKEAMQKNIEKAQKLRQDLIGEGSSLTCVRSAAPNGILSMRDFSTISVKWWKEGITTSHPGPSKRTDRLNPTFLALTDQRLVLHYGLEPLLGFPLATAYVPLHRDSSLYVAKAALSSADYLVACAYKQFRAWTQAFRQTISNCTIVRFCVADALAFPLTLRGATLSDKSVLTANISCDAWTCEPLVLDDTGYTDSTHAAPRRFDIIDTSNLIDHLGPLNIIPICATLLKHNVWSTLYTEILVQNDSSEKERIASLLGANVETVALLFGLSPCEISTNATNSPEDESLLNVANYWGGRKKIAGSTQVRSRLRWKRAYSSTEDGLVSPITIDSTQMVRLLIKLYDHMFEHENVTSLFASLQSNTLSKRTNPYYNRASFGLLLHSLRTTVSTDWKQCLLEMVPQIYAGFDSSPCGANFAQELLLYMHLFGLDTTQLSSIDLEASRDANLAPFFRSWTNIPTSVCVTLQVPRKKLQLFTKNAGMKTGTPTLRCDLEGGGAISRAWANTFASILITFGRRKLSQQDGVPVLHIEEDDSNWWGSSDMFVSAFVPTWTILQPDKTTPRLRCGLLPTPQSSRAFLADLGLTLDIFGAEMTSANVTISRYMPAMMGMPKILLPTSHSLLKSQNTVSATLSSNDFTIQRLIYRYSYAARTEGSILRDRATAVQVSFQDVWRASIKIGNEPESQVSFPIPVDHLRQKVRIARTSSYVEIEAPLWNPQAETSSTLIFPTILCEKSDLGYSGPVSWTATRVKLDVLPIMDIKDKRGSQWLTTHATMMFSNKERRIRELGIAGRATPESTPNLRVEIKDGLFSMLMTYTGIHGQQISVHGLSKEIGGINIIFLISSIRLDLINRTVVLDAAAIPLTTEMNKDNKVRSFYESLTSRGIMQTKVSDDELRSWKSMLPALVERCRLWSHTPKCEYTITGEIPIIKGLEDGYSPLCSCGIGQFPPGYLQDLKYNNLQHVLKNYATRVAISPIFPVPYVEDCFLTGISLSELQQSTPPPSAGKGCAQCGSEKRKNTADKNFETKLLLCSGCRKTSYCSAECQKADWKNHKKVCVKK